MLGLLFRLAALAAGLIGFVLLFVYAAVVALIFIPVVIVLVWVLRKRGVVRWTTVELRNAQYQPRGPQDRPSHGPSHGPTVIDHDPNDVTLERGP
ncbi:MAG: hypothetical protein IT566_04595 [Rhodospirillaceae bacterium]|nr:hypothetical protein [Rhodospirillaceae bacterium]